MISTAPGNTFPSKPLIQTGIVQCNERICTDHYRLMFEVAQFPDAEPGEFVHLCPERHPSIDTGDFTTCSATNATTWLVGASEPLLRRAYSIAGFVRSGSRALITVIYRVVGAGTRWLSSLTTDDPISVLGPLGNRFPISKSKQHAWCVAGGVGLPPMLWLAEFLSRADRTTVAFCGAQEKELLALSLDQSMPVNSTARTATKAAGEFARFDVPVVLSTDDGSIGFRGYVGSAMAAYHEANPVSATDLVVYTCGPEPMMRSVAEYCTARAIECYVCMERSMACGLGTCQSCVVPVHDASDIDGWRYELCCTGGPVFDVRDVIWESPTTAARKS